MDAFKHSSRFGLSIWQARMSATENGNRDQQNVKRNCLIRIKYLQKVVVATTHLDHCSPFISIINHHLPVASSTGPSSPTAAASTPSEAHTKHATKNIFIIFGLVSKTSNIFLTKFKPNQTNLNSKYFRFRCHL